MTPDDVVTAEVTAAIDPLGQAQFQKAGIAEVGVSPEYLARETERLEEMDADVDILAAEVELAETILRRKRLELDNRRRLAREHAKYVCQLRERVIR